MRNDPVNFSRFRLGIRRGLFRERHVVIRQFYPSDPVCEPAREPVRKSLLERVCPRKRIY
jgi:hypothetical protein